MRRRPAFTLVEMLVSMALVLFIMVILTEAFGKGLESFRTLKAIGDMESRLRAAGEVLKRDLAADHFEGKRRLSEDAFTWKLHGPPREGVFMVMQLNDARLRSAPEGSDADQLQFRRAANWLLHFTAKARGNNRSEFFTANLPPVQPPPAPHLLTRRTTFFDQAPDARFQDQANIYSGQWAEMAYFLWPSGQATPGDGGAATPLYTLYRCQYVMVADNSLVNWPVQPQVVIPAAQPALYAEMSCYPFPRTASGGTQATRLHFCTPNEAALPRLLMPNRVTGDTAFEWPLPNDPQPPLAAMPLLSEVVSFDVSLYVRLGSDVVEVVPDVIGSLGRRIVFNNTEHPDVPIQAVKITLRIYEPKTKQTRQMTLLQDL